MSIETAAQETPTLHSLVIALQRNYHMKTVNLLPLFLLIHAGCENNDDVTDFQPVKPAYEFSIESPEDDPTTKNHNAPDPQGDAIRKQSIAILARAGFHPAESLPTLGHRRAVVGKLRPHREITLRLMALNALFTYASAPEAAVKTDRINAYVQRNQLRKHLTTEELAILNLPRGEAIEKHIDAIGWKLENMWSLAWMLGFDPAPSATTGMLEAEITEAIIMNFLPGLDTSVDDLLQKAKPRSELEVLTTEDLFYSAHNAVRSAQTGSKTSVPAGFHPVRDGGAIHERRHSLSWAISPEVKWNDADLST